MAALTDLTASVIGYLLAQAAANASLGAAAPPVVILDGQPATQDPWEMNATGLTQWLMVGGDGWAQPGQMGLAASSEQGFAFIDQARTRDNVIEVHCAAMAVAGSALPADARAGAYGVMAAVELMLRGSPGTTPPSPGDATMGGLVYWSEVGGPIEFEQGQGTQGAEAVLRFRVGAVVRLTS